MRHEHCHHFRGCSRLYCRGTIMACHETSARECVVGPDYSHQLRSARHHHAGRSNLESLAKPRLDFRSEEPLQRLVSCTDHLSLLHLYLLLVASVSTRVAISLANASSDSPFGAPTRDCHQFLQTSRGDLDQFDSEQCDCLSLIRRQPSHSGLLHDPHCHRRIFLSLEY